MTTKGVLAAPHKFLFISFCNIRCLLSKFHPVEHPISPNRSRLQRLRTDISVLCTHTFLILIFSPNLDFVIMCVRNVTSHFSCHGPLCLHPAHYNGNHLWDEHILSSSRLTSSGSITLVFLLLEIERRVPKNCLSLPIRLFVYNFSLYIMSASSLPFLSTVSPLLGSSLISTPVPFSSFLSPLDLSSSSPLTFSLFTSCILYASTLLDSSTGGSRC